MKALVTGAGTGLGRAIARRLADDGYEIWIHYHSSPDEARTLLAEVEETGGKGRLACFDVSDEDKVNRILAPMLSEHGPLDVLVNNAGVTANSYMMMQPAREWNQVMSVNLGGFFLVTRACLKGMIGEKSGRIVNIGSLAGERGNIGQVAYAASKAGLAGATRALALEVARWNILVNAVSPGPLDVGMAADLDLSKIEPQIPLGRVGRAKEVAGVVSFLCSEDSAYMTGQVISVNGGMGL
jgi:3-oxoacyl-[acyl-carrier protein] reductase